MTLVGALAPRSRSPGAPPTRGGPGRSCSVSARRSSCIVAQLTDPGTAAQLAVIGVAVLGYVAWGLVAAPARRGVRGPRHGAGRRSWSATDGELEGTFFLVRDDGALHVVVPRLDHPGRRHRGRGGRCSRGWSPRAGCRPPRSGGRPGASATAVHVHRWARVLHRHRELIEQLEAAQEALAEQAVAEERRRIARELHDLAGHTLAAVLLHVTGARHVLRRDVDEAERALVDAETVGRASLDQIRATVAALRTDERGTDAGAGGIGRPRRRSSTSTAGPGSPSRRTSHRRRPDIDGPDGHGAPPHRSRGARQRRPPRAGQRRGRHRGARRARAAAAVVDHGQAPATPTPGPGHFGIIGMRERARALGGQLDAGPTADGWPSRRGCHRSRWAAAPRCRRDPRADRRRPTGRPCRRRPHPRDRTTGSRWWRSATTATRCSTRSALHQPDVVLMDVRMRRVDGVTATRAAAGAGRRAAGARAHDLRRRRRPVGCPRCRRGGVRPQGRRRPRT